MEENKYLSIAEFAEAAGVSKQAIYKQINNDKSQLTPFLLRRGKKTFILCSALVELYNVKVDNFTTHSTPEVEEKTTLPTPEVEEEAQLSTPEVEEVGEQSTPEVEEKTTLPTHSTPENQPLSTDYIEFLKGEIAELKAQREQTEQRLNATIQEKDQIIKSQADQLADLAQKVAAIANNAIMTTSQQQYLTAAERQIEKPAPPENGVVIEEEAKKSFWGRLFGK